MIRDNVSCMKSIKALCDENGVDLIVVAGPVFFSKRAEFECNAYYDYMEQLVEVVNVWDFTGITNINNNPHNFYDPTHYNDAVANEMIKTIFNDTQMNEEFGILLTNDNVEFYLYNRKKDF